MSSTDILFIVDGSSSVGRDNFETVKKFIVKLIEDIPSSGRRVAMVQFSKIAETEFLFDAYPGASNDVISSEHLCFDLLDVGSLTNSVKRSLNQKTAE